MNTVSLALKLVFAVVIFELLIVGGTVIKCFDTDSCDENDSNNITLILNSIYFNYISFLYTGKYEISFCSWLLS